MYTSNIKPIKRPHFTKEEDEKLIKLVEKYGDDKKSWSLISKEIKTKNPKRCRERWFKYLHPDALMWNDNEDKIVLEKYEEIGPKWTKIAGLLPGKNSIQVKNRFINLNNKTNNIHVVVNNISNPINNIQQSNNSFVLNTRKLNDQKNQTNDNFEIDLFDDNNLKRFFDSLKSTNNNFSNQNNFLEKQ